MDKYSLKRSLFFLVGALILSVGVGTYADAVRPKTIEVTIDDQTKELYTSAPTVADVFAEIGFDEADTAILNVSLDDGISDDMDIDVTTQKDITYVYAGEKQEIHTYKQTVGELLKEQGAVIDEWDVITPTHATRLKDGDVVQVDKIEVENTVESIALPFEEKTEKTNDLYEGETKVSQEGVAGKREVETQTTHKNGAVVDQKVVRDEVVVEPTAKITLVGTKVRPVVTRSGVELTNVKRKLTMESTAYTHTGNRTASGLPAAVGRVAVDPRVIPLGTKLYIEGYGHAVAADTGGAIKGNILDLFFNSEAECYRWGRRDVTVYILGN